MTPDEASRRHDELKRLMMKEDVITRRLRRILDELTAAAGERQRLDEEVYLLVSDVDASDEAMLDLMLMGIDVQKLYQAYVRIGKTSDGIFNALKKAKLLGAVRKGREGEEEDDQSG